MEGRFWGWEGEVEEDFVWEVDEDEEEWWVWCGCCTGEWGGGKSRVWCDEGCVWCGCGQDVVLVLLFEDEEEELLWRWDGPTALRAEGVWLRWCWGWVCAGWHVVFKKVFRDRPFLPPPPPPPLPPPRCDATPLTLPFVFVFACVVVVMKLWSASASSNAIGEPTTCQSFWRPRPGDKGTSRRSEGSIMLSTAPHETQKEELVDMRRELRLLSVSMVSDGGSGSGSGRERSTVDGRGGMASVVLSRSNSVASSSRSGSSSASRWWCECVWEMTASRSSR